MSQTPAEFSYAADEIDLLDLVRIVWQSRRLIVGLTLLAAIIGFAATVVGERTYESRAVFVVQGQQLSTAQEQGPLYSTATLASLLNSRVLAEAVVDNLQLTSRWDNLDRANAVRRLQEAVSISANERDGIVTVKFADTDPVLARDIVAAYVTEFEALANELNLSEASRVVTFTQERLAAVEAQLQAAEEALRAFRDQHGIVDFEQQTAALIEAHAAVTDQIRVLTVELSGKRAYLNEQHPEVQDLVGRIEELERQRLAIERGQEVAELGVRFGLNAVPALSIELRRLEREAERQGEMYDLLRQQYEAARLDASQNTIRTRLIDPPQVPDQALGRGVSLAVVLSAFVGAFGGLVLAFALEFFRQRAQDEQAVQELPFLRFFRDQRKTNAS